MNDFCLVKAVDRFSERIVVAIADAADRRFVPASARRSVYRQHLPLYRHWSLRQRATGPRTRYSVGGGVVGFQLLTLIIAAPRQAATRQALDHGDVQRTPGIRVTTLSTLTTARPTRISILPAAATGFTPFGSRHGRRDNRRRRVVQHNNRNERSKLSLLRAAIRRHRANNMFALMPCSRASFAN